MQHIVFDKKVLILQNITRFLSSNTTLQCQSYCENYDYHYYLKYNDQ